MFYTGFVNYAGNLCLLYMLALLCSMHFATYYAHNYAGIIGSSLSIMEASIKISDWLVHKNGWASLFYLYVVVLLILFI